MRSVAFALAIILLLLSAPALATEPPQPEPDPIVAKDAAVCLAALSDAPVGSCAALYAHIREPSWVLPLNIQIPPKDAQNEQYHPDDFVEVDPAPPQGTARVYLYPVDQEVAYEGAAAEETWRVGLGSSFRLVPEAPIIGSWPLSFPDPGPPACLNLDMQLRDGRERADATVLAQGDVSYAVAGTDPLGATGDALQGLCPGAQGVVERGAVHDFQVDLGATNASISSYWAFHVQVDWNVTVPATLPDAAPVEGEWILHSGPDHRPRMVFPIEEAGRVLWGMSSSSRGYLGPHPALLSPWGSWEFNDTARAQLRILDQSGDPIDPEHLSPPRVQEGRFHWDWEWHDENPRPEPPFTFIVEVENLQGTAVVTGEREYDPPGGRFLLPGPAVGLVLVAIAAILLVGKSRWRQGSGGHP